MSRPRRGAHQENSREQTFASCSGLGFSSRDTGRILPAWTRTGEGRGVGAAGATRRCEARPQAPLMEAVGNRTAWMQDPRCPQSRTGLQTLPEGAL